MSVSLKPQSGKASALYFLHWLEYNGLYEESLVFVALLEKRD